MGNANYCHKRISMKLLRDKLRELSDIIFDHEDVFIDMFMGNMKVYELIDVNFSDNSISYVCILDCGQHIRNYITYDQFDIFREKIGDETKK